MTTWPGRAALRGAVWRAWAIAQSTSVVIAAFLAEGWAAGDSDEAVQLWNVGPQMVDLSGWSIEDGEGRAVFAKGADATPSSRLAPGAWAWVARDPTAFAVSFGEPARWCFAPGCAMRTAGGGPRLADGGDGLRLLDARGGVVDTVVWGTGDAAIAADGWVGEPVQPYGGAGLPRRGQVLYRKLRAPPVSSVEGPLVGAAARVSEAATEAATAEAAVAGAEGSSGPVPDTNRAEDWASDPHDPEIGRRVRFPGWDLEAEARPRRAIERATLELAVAPDGLHGFLAHHWGAAQRSIDLLAYSFDQPELAELLAERARAGVRVRVLLDGSPVGGVEPDQRWALATMAAAGVELWWMERAGGPRRYRSAHAKLVVVDGLWVMLGTENPTAAAAPAGGGARGRRGAWLATDAPSVLAWAAGIVARDLDPRHPDLSRWQARDPRRGAPAPGYAPPRVGEPGGPLAPAGPGPWAEPLRVRGLVPVEMISAPENALSVERGLLGLLGAAGEGDTVRVAQMREAPWWGDPEEGEVARNPRLAAYVAAARRGARVRVLLDRHFDDPDHWNANAVAVRWLHEVASVEGLDLEARLGNPTGAGLHAKVVLVDLAGSAGRVERVEPAGPGARPSTVEPVAWYRELRGGGGRWIHLGSLNGSEAASKTNREVALQVGSPALHDRLAAVFEADWAASPPGRVWLPVLGVGGR